LIWNGENMEQKYFDLEKECADYIIYADPLSIKRLKSVINEVRNHSELIDKKQLKILDMGCGLGGMTFPLSALGHHVVGLDLDPKSILVCNQKNTFPEASYQVGNGECLKLDEKFDVVICSEVMEHSPYPELILQSIRRHLNPRGIGIITVPNGYCFYEILFSRIFQKIGILSLFHRLPRNIYTSLTGSPSPYHSMNVCCHHVQFFSLQKISELFKKNNFNILKIHNLSLGILLDWKCLSNLKSIECSVADSAPHFIAGGWVFVIKPTDE
jgi:2-polyprenyl-3-methyl-5-hydroxy-6-metoxy-1,4-benzoquinol methylase